MDSYYLITDRVTEVSQQAPSPNGTELNVDYDRKLRERIYLSI